MSRRLVFEGGPVREIAKIHADGRRIFLGFSDREIAPMFRDFETRVHLTPPRVYQLEDVRLQPVIRRSPTNFTGGPFKASMFLDELALRRGSVGRETRLMTGNDSSGASAFIDKRPVTQFHTAWFGGYLLEHYGHFLLEGLARVMGNDVVNSEWPILFFNPTRLKTLEPFMNAVFGFLGVDLQRVVLCNTPVEIQTLWIQEPTFQIGGYVNTSVRHRLRRASLPGLPQSGLVYVSRTRTKKIKTVLDEDKLEELLRSRASIRVIYPEQLSIAEQIASLSGAEIVSGCEGSAFHSLIFADGARTSLVLCPRAPNLNYILCDELIDGDSIYVKCDTDSRQAAEGKYNKSWTLDVEKAFRIISDASVKCKFG